MGREERDCSQKLGGGIPVESEGNVVYPSFHTSDQTSRHYVTIQNKKRKGVGGKPHPQIGLEGDAFEARMR